MTQDGRTQIRGCHVALSENEGSKPTPVHAPRPRGGVVEYDNEKGGSSPIYFSLPNTVLYGARKRGIEMKIPKTVQISGKKYHVSRDGRSWGGHGSTGRQRISVGTSRDQTPARKFDNYVHEVTEMILCERHNRFSASDEEIVFVLNHKQFSDFASDIASALWPMVKK